MPGKVFNLAKGVLSFNGRRGIVVPKDGDYTPDQIGAADKELSNLTDYQKALHNIGGSPNKNILDNSYFVGGGTSGNFPINQRGQTQYESSGLTFNPAFDRWKTYTSIAELSSSGIVIGISGDAPYGALSQSLSGSFDLNQKYTISVLLANGELYFSTGTGQVSLQYGNNGNYIRVTDAKDFQFIVYVYDPSEIIVACKVEYGDKQTLAYKDSNASWKLFEIPNYVEELQKLQRYLYVPSISWENPQFRFYGESENRLIGIFPFPSQMRTKPVISGFPITFRDNDSGYNVIVESAQPLTCEIGLTLLYQLNTTSGNFVDQHMYSIISKIEFSAEL